MKKALTLAAILLAFLAGGVWLATRRQPMGTPLADHQGLFQVEPAGAGRLLKLQDPLIPLRALRWLAPARGGLMAAQVVTQSDRQMVAFFRDGQPAYEVVVPKPFGVGEGFWRFAVLKDVVALPGGDAALLYTAAEAASTEPSVLMAMDLAHGDLRWTHRGAFARMVLTEDKEPALYCFSSAGPVQRLAIAAASAGDAGRSGPNAAARTIELPAEVQGIDALLPTGANAFLVAHAKGLSAYQGSRGWTHLPMAEPQGVPCVGWHAALVRAGRKLWWQPWPGPLIEVLADGSRQGQGTPAWPEADPFAPDAQLLRVLGADASGALWFALATPSLPGAMTPGTTPAPGAVAAATAASAPTDGPAEAPAEEAKPPMDWAAYTAAQPLDRLYRWDAAKRRLERCSWSQVWPALNAPSGLARPTADLILHPEAGALLLEAPQSAWWLPLATLPFH